MKRYSLALLIPALLCIGIAYGDKPDKPGGGKPGGGGDGGDSNALFNLTDLGGFTDGDGVQSEALNLNNPDSDGRMKIVGYSYKPVDGSSERRGAIWDVSSNGSVTKLTDVTPANQSAISVTQVNDFGQAVAGDYVWIPGQGHVGLPGFGDGIGFPAMMNSVGDILGTATDSNGDLSIAMWHIDVQGNVDGPAEIDFGDGSFWPLDMNDLRVMAGYVRESDGSDVAAIAFVDDFGVLQVMPLGALPGDTSSEATAINNNCEVVGTSFEAAVGSDGIPGVYPHAFLWKPSAGFTSLGDFGGGQSRAYDINDSTQVVGEAWSDYGKQHQRAFLWQDGVMLDLNEVTDTGGSKAHLFWANAINNTGYIAGELHIGKPVSEAHGFLLAPKTSSP